MRMTFWGDYIPTDKYDEIIDVSKKDVLGEIRNILKSSTLNFVNVDASIYNKKNAITKSGPHVGLKKKSIANLKDFTVAGLANNHIKDYGLEGILQIKNALTQAGVDTTGAGVNLNEAQIDYNKDFNEINVTIISACEHEFSHASDSDCGAAPYDLISIYRRIKIAKKEKRKVILSLHVGYELFKYPTPSLRRECHFFAEAGADLIICHHSHVAGVYEKFKKTSIYYGLGDLIFEGHHQGKAGEGYGVIAEWNAKEELFECSIVPYRQSPELGGVQILCDNALEDFLRWQDLNNSRLENGDWKKQWDLFVETLKPSLFARLFLPVRFPGIAKLMRISLLRKIIIGTNPLDKLNLVRCESLRAAVIKSLESDFGNE
jgi:hypothetical protein